MSDILERLAHCIAGTVTPEDRDAITLEACAEIARLRLAIRRLAEQDATLSVQGGRVTVTMDATLTDAEREAIAYFAVIDGPQFLPAANAAATTLRVLLERLGATNETDGYVE